MRYDNFKLAEIKNNRKGYVLTSKLFELGFFIVKYNSGPRGWSLNVTDICEPIKDMGKQIHWSSSLKNLDSYITRHKDEIINKYGESFDNQSEQGVD